MSESSAQKGQLNRFNEAFGWLCCLVCWRAEAKAHPWPSWVAKVHAPTEHANGSCLYVQTFDQPAWPLQIRDLRDPFVLSVKGLTSAQVYRSVSPSQRKPSTTVKGLPPISGGVWTWSIIDHGLDENELRHELMLSFNCGINAENADGEMDKELPSQYEFFTMVQGFGGSTIIIGGCRWPVSSRVFALHMAGHQPSVLYHRRGQTRHGPIWHTNKGSCGYSLGHSRGLRS